MFRPEEKPKPRCPKCGSEVDLINGSCPDCGKLLIRTCVICKESFRLDWGDNNQRQVCYREECIKKFRYFCGIGDRYWRTPQQIEAKKRYKENARRKKLAKK